jgi:hypothetical protein
MLGVVLATPGCSTTPTVDGRSAAWIEHQARQSSVLTVRVLTDSPPLVCPHCGEPMDWPGWAKGWWARQNEAWQFLDQWAEGRRPWPGPKPDEMDTPWPAEATTQPDGDGPGPIEAQR